MINLKVTFQPYNGCKIVTGIIELSRSRPINQQWRLHAAKRLGVGAQSAVYEMSSRTHCGSLLLPRRVTL